MKTILGVIFVISFSLVTEARRPRDLNEWDSIRQEIQCVHQMRIFLNQAGYAADLPETPELLSISGVPRRKIKCNDNLVEDLGEGIAVCSTDPSRNTYRFSGSGFDCPRRTIDQIKISNEVQLRIQLDDKCETYAQGDQFADQDVIKTPRSISDDAIQSEARQKLEEAITDIYRNIDLTQAFAGKTRAQIEQIEFKLSQNIFNKVNCSVRYQRDSEIWPVMRQAVDRVCGAKRSALASQNERCMIEVPGGYRSVASSSTPAAPQAPSPAPDSAEPEVNPTAPPIDEDND